MQIVKKNLYPRWDESFKHNADGRSFHKSSLLTFSIFDHDRVGADDPMGVVVMPLSSLLDGHVSDKWHDVKPCKGASDARGQLHLKISCAMRRAVSIKAGESVPLEQRGMVAVGLGWDMLRGGQAIDLDTSCVALSFQGKILEDETVYFAQLKSTSGALEHTGDEQEGDEVSAMPCVVEACLRAMWRVVVRRDL